MLNKCSIAIAIAAFGLAAPVAAPAQAPSVDVPREDRQNGQRAEVNVSVPRNADGSLDLQSLAATIQNLFTGGVREVRIREQGLSPQDLQLLTQLAQQLGDSLGLDRVRIRQDDGRLRIDLRGERVENPDHAGQSAKADQSGRVDQVARIDHPERVDRTARVDRPDRSGRH